MTDPQIPRIPPSNVEAEHGLLGAVLLNNGTYREVSGFLLPEHFSYPVHGRIYEAIGNLVAQGQPADSVTLRHLFDGDPSLAALGGSGYLARLAAAAATVLNVRHYGMVIYKLARRRNIIQALEETLDEAYLSDMSEDDILRHMHEEMPAQVQKSFVTTSTNEIMATVYPPLRWAIPDYVPEGLSIFAGRQKLGKTWMAIDFALAVAVGGIALSSIECNAGDVLYLDLENGPRRIKRRIATLLPYVRERPDMSRLRWATMSPQLGLLFIESCESWRASVPNPTLIVIDVMQRIKPVGHIARNSYENDYDILMSLQQWATEHSVAVLVLHHTRKGGADDPLEALSGSNGIGACADTTLVLDRTESGYTLYVRGRDVDEKETALGFDAGRWTVQGDAEVVHTRDTRTKILDELAGSSEPMGPNDIADAIGEARATVKMALSRMLKAGDVQRRGRGRYTIASKHVN